jgi:hypothetical protein
MYSWRCGSENRIRICISEYLNSGIFGARQKVNHQQKHKAYKFGCREIFFSAKVLNNEYTSDIIDSLFRFQEV